MKTIEASTHILPIIDVGTYGTILEDLYDHDGELVQTIMTIAAGHIEETIKDATGHTVRLVNRSYWSPREYNFTNDRMDFDLLIPTALYDQARAFVGDDVFFAWLQGRYGSHSGFISFAPYTRDEWAAALTNEDNDKHNRAICIYIMWMLHLDGFDERAEHVQYDLYEDISGYYTTLETTIDYFIEDCTATNGAAIIAELRQCLAALDAWQFEHWIDQDYIVNQVQDRYSMAA
jgi:hypothetical protein